MVVASIESRLCGADIDDEERVDATRGDGAVDVKEVAGQHRHGL
jgi:hypothetical protein